MTLLEQAERVLEKAVGARRSRFTSRVGLTLRFRLTKEPLRALDCEFVRRGYTYPARWCGRCPGGHGVGGLARARSDPRRLTRGRDNARFATEDEFIAFARPDGVAPATLVLADQSVLSTPLDEKIAMAIELECMVRAGDDRIRQVDSANYSDYVAEAVIVSTTGIKAADERSGAYVSVEAIATDGTHDQTGWGLSAGRSPRELDITVAASDAVSRATRMLGAVKPSSMKCMAVFDPRSTATLLAIVVVH